ncbi:extracellular solute-binding protein [Candidatus Parcubacteria bacterium]|nr:extracellular solute-binding protein [Candidatus Parcubacteria bacterium]
MTTRWNKIGVLLTALALVGAGCAGPSEAQQVATRPVTLKVWQVFENQAAFEDLMNTYRAIHPNVSFEYSQKRADEYEEELLHAFARGEGPDIFTIHNTWIGEYVPLIEPLPPSLNIAYAETRGSIKKETVYLLKQEPTLSFRALKNDFVDAVAKDVVRSYRPNANANPQDRIFGLPLSVDTLALYFNRDLLNAGGIAEPPASWSAFQDQVTKLTRIGQNSQVLQSGAALGTGKNVERATDILNLLMLQNGVTLVDDRGVATFAANVDKKEGLAADALRFYTDFANPLKQVYTWNEAQPNSFDAFVSGKTAFFFGYSYHAALIKARSPKLNFAIASAPQIEGGKVVNYANYWVQTVARQTKNRDWAWDFVQFATGKEPVGGYLEATRSPSARRSLIAGQLEDEILSVFSSQTLTSTSWYRGRDAKAAEKAFEDLIDAALSGADVERELVTAQNKINQTL